MTVGPDRATAIDRMRRALDEVEVTGIQTTLPFDRALMRDPAFAAGDLSTDWVADRWDGAADRALALDEAARVAARAADGTTTMRSDASASADAAGSPPRAAPSLRKDTAGSCWRNAGRSAATDRWPR
jgi:acetyl/propionyl-CoA carboxylase alpha subunit